MKVFQERYKAFKRKLVRVFKRTRFLVQIKELKYPEVGIKGEKSFKYSFYIPAGQLPEMGILDHFSFSEELMINFKILFKGADAEVKSQGLFNGNAKVNRPGRQLPAFSSFYFELMTDLIQTGQPRPECFAGQKEGFIFGRFENNS